MIILDTNVVIGYLIIEDSLHNASRALLARYTDENLFISREIWQEIINMMSRKQGGNITVKVMQQVERLVQLHDFQINDKSVWEQTFIPQLPHKLSFTDCTLLYLAEHQNCQVLTFDQELQRYLP